MSAKDTSKSEDKDAVDDEGAKTQLQGRQYKHLDGKRGGAVDLDQDEKAKRDDEYRTKLKEMYFKFTLDLVDKPYKDIYEQMESMFAWMLDKFRAANMTEEELTGIEDIIIKHETRDEWPGHQVPHGYGDLKYASLLELLREAGEHKELEEVDTFSISEVFNIVSEYQHTDVIKTQDLLRWWKASVAQSVIARKNPRPIVSGAFVSAVYQHLGVLKKEQFFLPHQFAQQSKMDKDGKIKNDGLAVEAMAENTMTKGVGERKRGSKHKGEIPIAAMFRIGAEVIIPQPKPKQVIKEVFNENEVEDLKKKEDLKESSAKTRQTNFAVGLSPRGDGKMGISIKESMMNEEIGQVEF